MTVQPQPSILPPTARGLCRVEAAAYVGVGPSTFDRLVGEKKMPVPKRVYSRTIWDVRALDRAFDALDSGDSSDHNPWD